MKRPNILRRSKTLNGSLVFFAASVMIISAFLTFLLLAGLRMLQIMPDIRSAPTAMLITTLTVSVLIGIAVSLVVSRMVLSPIHRLISGTRSVAKGDFTVKIDEGGTAGEMRELIESFNTMTKELGGIEIFKNDFINTFSHELKTPIVSISGFAKQLKSAAITEDERREYTDIIINESERLSKMSSGILLLTKLENQQIISDRVLYSLDDQLRDCILLFQKQWEEKELILNIELESVQYFGNRELMSHVWRNLMENAVKFSLRGGEISVKCYMKYNTIHVIISNDCAPLDQDTVDHMFDKFYQGDTSRAASGNGLGLSLVKRIIQLCGGYITVESNNRKDISFDIELTGTDASYRNNGEQNEL